MCNVLMYEVGVEQVNRRREILVGAVWVCVKVVVAAVCVCVKVHVCVCV